MIWRQPSCGTTIDGIVSVHRAPHLRRSRALEVRTVRLRARRLAPTAPCKRLLFKGLNYTDQINPVNGYVLFIFPFKRRDVYHPVFVESTFFHRQYTVMMELTLGLHKKRSNLVVKKLEKPHTVEFRLQSFFLGIVMMIFRPPSFEFSALISPS
jgi:hypothetical protein